MRHVVPEPIAPLQLILRSVLGDSHDAGTRRVWNEAVDALTERVLKIEAFSKALLEQTPLRRFGTSEDVARAALFFASDESAFITGAELAVDGGMQATL